MKTYISPWIAGSIVLIAGLISIALLSSVTRADPRDCTDPNAPPTCGLEKATRVAQEDAAAIMTADAIPTEPGVRVSPVPIDFSLIPTNVIKIRRLEGDDRVIPGMDYSIVNDAWAVGNVPGAPGMGPGTLYVLARRPFEDFKTSSIGYYVWGNWPAKDWDQYFKFWTAPKDIGEITITSITGPTGIVSFTTSTGVISTFDLAKKTWSLK